jgi:hypothetical protein
VPLTPTPVIGEQVNPTRPVTEPMGMPKLPRRSAVTGLLAVEVLSQHWTLPVLHWLVGGGVVGVATARVAMARAVKAESVNCMVSLGGLVGGT